MTQQAAKKLVKGTEIFNVSNGEVICYTGAIGKLGPAIFIEGIDNNGKLRVWKHELVEKV